MRLSKVAKKVVSLAMAIAVVATSVAVSPVAKSADAAAKYTGYLCLATGKWTFRNTHDDSKFSSKLQNTTNELSADASKAKFKDVSMKKAKKAATYTVSLTGLKKGVISEDKTFNTLFVDTTIPGSMKKKVTVTNVKVYMDNKLTTTIKKPVITPDDGKDGFYQIQVINTWNDKVKAFKYTMPKKSIKITYTIKFK